MKTTNYISVIFYLLAAVVTFIQNKLSLAEILINCLNFKAVDIYITRIKTRTLLTVTKKLQNRTLVTFNVESFRTINTCSVGIRTDYCIVTVHIRYGLCKCSLDFQTTLEMLF